MRASRCLLALGFLIALGCDAPTPNPGGATAGGDGTVPAPAGTSAATPRGASASATPDADARAALADPSLRAAYIAQLQALADASYGFGREPQSSAELRVQAANAARRMTVTIAEGRVQLRPVGATDARTSLELRLSAVGRAGALSPAPAVTASDATDNRVTLIRDGLREWYLNGPLGLEQGFDVLEAPAGDGSLALELAPDDDVAPELSPDGESVALLRGGAASVGRYGELHAVDADGSALPSRLDVRDGRIRLLVDDAAARYPIRIDPLLWVETRLYPRLQTYSGMLFVGEFVGLSVDLSGDTLITGAPGAGVALVFVRRDDRWHPQATLVPPAGAPLGYGWVVAVDGNTAVVTSPNGCAVTGTGEAHVFVRSGAIWAYRGAVTASGAPPDNGFGCAADVDGDTLLVGAPEDTDNGDGAGAVYAFRRSGTVFTETQKVFVAQGQVGAGFGGSLSLDGQQALIGASGEDAPELGSGAAYIFHDDGTEWVEGPRLTPGDPQEYARFGDKVALRGNLAIVGALDYDIPAIGFQVGTAYVFESDGNDWSQAAQLNVASANESDRFGHGVAIDGDTALVSAWQRGDLGTYAFERIDGVWTEEGPLDVTTSFLRNSVAMEGDTAVVGTTIDARRLSTTGVVTTFRRSDGGWARHQELSLGDADAGDEFGTRVAVSGERLLVSAPGDDEAGADQGAVFAFERTDVGWAQAQKLLPDAALVAADASFGRQLAMDGDTAMVSAPNDDTGQSNSGAVLVYMLTDGLWTFHQKIEPPAPTVNGSFGRAISLSGDMAAIAENSTRPTYVFKRSGTLFASYGQVTRPPNTFSSWSAAVAIDGDTLLVTGEKIARAYRDDGAGNWSVEQDIAPNDTDNYNFGYSIALRGDTALIGATGTDVGTYEGAAYLFTRSGTVWTQQHDWHPDGADAFARDVALGDTAALVTGSYADAPEANSGAVYVYERLPNGQYAADGKLAPVDLLRNENFGRALAFDGVRAVVGAPRKDDTGMDSGAAYVFDLSRVALGGACLVDDECTSTFCAGGVCCDAACDGPCESCASLFKQDGSADGQCGRARTGSVCAASAGCVSNGEVALPSTCDDQGACRQNPVTCADGFACVGGLCRFTCEVGGVDDDSFCVQNHHCEAGACIADRSVGDSCTRDAQCESGDCSGTNCLGKLGDACDVWPCAVGYCTDGVCCNTPCGGQCEACAEAGSEGMCIPVTGTPRGSRAPCVEHPECGGSCNGSVSQACTYPGQATVCEAASCQGAVLERARTCDGTGRCGIPSTQDCGAYACDAAGDRCKARCDSRADCAAGALCRFSDGQCAFVPSVCVDAFTVELADGTQSSCGGYRCLAGDCLERCSDDGDCADGLACEGDACVEPPSTGADAAVDAPDAGADASTTGNESGDAATTTGRNRDAGEVPDEDAAEDDGCGCRAPGRSRGHGGGLAALGLAVGLALARRRRARAVRA